MGAGWMGTNENLKILSEREGHPNPSAVQSMGELMQWVYENRVKKEVQMPTEHELTEGEKSRLIELVERLKRTPYEESAKVGANIQVLILKDGQLRILKSQPKETYRVYDFKPELGQTVTDSVFLAEVPVYHNGHFAWAYGVVLWLRATLHEIFLQIPPEYLERVRYIEHVNFVQSRTEKIHAGPYSLYRTEMTLFGKEC